MAIVKMASEEFAAAQAAGMYEKPVSGIPASDLSAAVQASLGKADTALQEHQSRIALGARSSAAFNRSFAWNGKDEDYASRGSGTFCINADSRYNPAYGVFLGEYRLPSAIVEMLAIEGATNRIPEFSETAAYAIGNFVRYNGYIYKFKAVHEPGEWDSSEVIWQTPMLVLKALLGEKADQATTYTKTEVDSIVDAAKNGRFAVVQALPPAGEAEEKVIYLLPRTQSESGNVYDEYVVVSGAWERLGSTEIDLTGYVQINDPRLSDARTPTAHKSSHATGGADALTPADIGAQPTLSQQQLDNIAAVPNKADASDLRYIFNAATVPSGATPTVTGLADLAKNTATLGSSVTDATIVLPAATDSRARDFFLVLTIEATTAPALTWRDPATNADADIDFGESSLALIDTGKNLILFSELPGHTWTVGVRHEGVST